MESPGSHKKHKKHKKHKHKKHRERGDDGEDVDVDVDVEDLEETPKPAIKLKIKFGGETLSVNKAGQAGVPGASPGGTKVPWEGGSEPVFAAKKPGDDTSDEEREWLEALEAGTLDDYGEVKKEKDPQLLTARQRALLHGGNKTQDLLELPSGYKTQELTEEQLQRRQQRAKKRREQAQQKQEKDKKQTLDRLLKKQETKAKTGKQGSRPKKTAVTGFRYLNNANKITISVPTGFEFPLHSQKQERAPVPQSCGVHGCKNKKKYSCSKTGVPLCSLECYRKNLQNQRPAILST